jgi:hypothetical protein
MLYLVGFKSLQIATIHETLVVRQYAYFSHDELKNMYGSFDMFPKILTNVNTKDDYRVVLTQACLALIIK